VTFLCADSNDLPNSVAIGVIVLICVFVSAFAWSWGPLGWLVSSNTLQCCRTCTLADEVCIASVVSNAMHTLSGLDRKAAAIRTAEPSWCMSPCQIPSEIHPLETRSAGQGINVCVNL
jgi:Sugar (and other) transporter